MSTERDPGGSEPVTRGDEPLVGPREDTAPAAETAAKREPAGGGEPAGGREPGAGAEVAHDSQAVEPASERDREAPPEFEERPRAHRDSPNMLPAREVRRSGVERLLVRLIATAGIVAIGVAIGAIMVSSNSQGWIVGLVVSIVTVVLAALLWSSRML